MTNALTHAGSDAVHDGLVALTLPSLNPILGRMGKSQCDSICRVRVASGWRLGALALLFGCSGGGGASVKAPHARRDAGVAHRPDAGAVNGGKERLKELLALPAYRYANGLDGIAGIVADGQTLLVYGTDLADRSFKRLTVTPGGSVKILTLKTKAQLDHPFDLQRCGGTLWVTKAIAGPGSKWRLLSPGLLLSSRGSIPIPPLGEPGWVVPKLLCDGDTGWLLWSTAKQTRVQLFRGGRWGAAQQLKAPVWGWPPFVVPRLRAVAWGGKLYLLRSSVKGLEAILVGAKGEIRRSALATGESPDVALARVGRRFLAMWVERTRRKTTFRDHGGRVLGRWLDSSFKPVGQTEVYVEQTPSSNVALHLWADDKGRLVMGRTDRRAVRRRRGFRYDISSHVTGYDVARKRLGPWLPAGKAPIHRGVWIGDTLFVAMTAVLTTPREADVRRFRFAP
ncbi:MAG: hypothetical protein ABI333_18435 [bacterium]